ncbi:MAG: hypothetical protein ACQKBU_07870 [Verrucomicrobiales bacterium]
MIPISGFTEDLGKHTGTIALWRKLRRFSSEEVCVQTPRVWNDDWNDIAAMIHRESAPETRILVCAYSWGAGHGFIKLARALHRFDRRIETAVLCDPVYRSHTIFGRWLAMVPGLKIRVPENVDDVFWLRQRNDRPSGHQPVGRDREINEAPHIYAPVNVRHARHGTIDDSLAYHRLALREASRITTEPPRRDAEGPILHD